jgi:hypothetical protein
MDVVAVLKDKQREEGIEQQQEFADRLGISHSHLSMLYSGKRQPGGKVIMRMIELWPDVFSGDGGNGDEHREVDTSDSGGGDGDPVPDGDLRLPGFGLSGGELDGDR